MNDIVSFGDWVRRRRKALDLTQATLASKVGCAVVTIKKIEQDQRRPSQTMARLLADQLEVSEANREKFVQMGRGEYVPELSSPVADILAESPQPEIPSFPSHSAPTPEVAPKQSLFVGRELELADLESHLEMVLAGHGRVILISGEAGRGKTTLMAEFARRAQANHPELITTSGNCNAFFGVGDPYLPFRDTISLLVGDLDTSWLGGPILREQGQRLWHFAPLTIRTIVEHSPDLINTLVPGITLLRQAATHFSDNMRMPFTSIP
jgi:transcriptional regulator with XRE-family HTH domain